MELTKAQLIKKITAYTKLSKELTDLGYCSGCETTSLKHFSLKSLMKHSKQFDLKIEVSYRTGEYPCKFTIPELKMFAISTAGEAIHLGVLTREEYLLSAIV